MASYSNMDDCTVTRRIEILKDLVIEATSCCVFLRLGSTLWAADNCNFIVIR